MFGVPTRQVRWPVLKAIKGLFATQTLHRNDIGNCTFDDYHAAELVGFCDSGVHQSRELHFWPNRRAEQRLWCLQYSLEALLSWDNLRLPAFFV